MTGLFLLPDTLPDTNILRHTNQVSHRQIHRNAYNDEYKAAHIPGAVLLTMETITAETAAKVLPDKNQLILIYCRSGRRSKIAAQNLLDIGYSNLIEFGGILDYKGKIEK